MQAGRTINRVDGTAIPLRGNDIDTDRVIPARYLRAVTFDGLGEHVFKDDRRAAAGVHPFDDERYAGAKILVVNRNFGSGSSREHAPQALLRWGIAAIVGESFAEIFFGNCYTLGVVCAVLPDKEIYEVQNIVESDPAVAVTVDVEECSVRAGDREWPFMIPQPVRSGFLSGRWDAIAELVENEAAVRAVHDRLPYLHGFGDE